MSAEGKLSFVTPIFATRILFGPIATNRGAYKLRTTRAHQHWSSRTDCALQAKCWPRATLV